MRLWRKFYSWLDVFALRYILYDYFKKSQVLRGISSPGFYFFTHLVTPEYFSALLPSPRVQGEGARRAEERILNSYQMLLATLSPRCFKITECNT